ncbi:hypothetical protein [Georgenia wangjunii]|uniref:hypothetical protein n=1 Tax=Georgenia wangjunii TaxID=3117730 RepID=UPI002F266485
MSTLTSPTSGGLFTYPRRTRRGPQWRRAAAWSLGANLVLAAWFWVIVAVGVTAALIVVDRVATVEMSIVQFAAQGATWFPFATAIIFATTQLGVHVANGMTRRAFIRAQLVTVVVSACAYALVLNLALLAEGALFARLGWPHTAGDDGFAAWQDGFAAGLLDMALIFLAAQVSGLLVGIAYYRFGGWWGTLLLPLTVAPVYASLLVADAAEEGWSAFALFTSPLALAAARVLLIALGALAFHRLARDVAIHRVTT